MANTKLNQVLAVEKDVKTRSYKAVNDLHQASKKVALMRGHIKTYRAKTEDGEKFPDDRLNVRFNSRDMLRTVQNQLIELFDVTATKDWSNMTARADVRVGDQILIAQAPVTYLLFLEKQLADLRKFVETLPDLDAATNWQLTNIPGVWKTDISVLEKTQKVKKALVLYEATDKHPAQAQAFDTDVTVGYWDTQNLSGEMQPAVKQRILDRIEQLTQAVKFAREEANSVDADKQFVGQAVLSFVFGSDLA